MEKDQIYPCRKVYLLEHHRWGNIFKRGIKLRSSILYHNRNGRDHVNFPRNKNPNRFCLHDKIQTIQLPQL